MFALAAVLALGLMTPAVAAEVLIWFDMSRRRGGSPTAP
jgi:hypothetical protein